MEREKKSDEKLGGGATEKGQEKTDSQLVIAE